MPVAIVWTKKQLAVIRIKEGTLLFGGNLRSFLKSKPKCGYVKDPLVRKGCGSDAVPFSEGSSTLETESCSDGGGPSCYLLINAGRFSISPTWKMMLSIRFAINYMLLPNCW